MAATIRRHGLSVVLAAFVPPSDLAKVAVVAWIPDFQHLRLPDLFSAEERKHRDDLYRGLAERATRVLLSSKAVAADFAEFAPTHVGKVRVLPFPSLLAFEPPGPPRLASAKFHLPEKFALVINQLWRHKNHRLVVDALALLRSGGPRVPVVMVGMPVDYRDPTNATLSELLQAIARAGVHDQVSILGFLPRDDLIDLMRHAALVIQPSRFEGWSTVVQDCKALGRPIICSDIPVHREQLANPLGFFPCDDPDALADLLAEYWADLEPGPDLERERGALAAEQAFAASHGESLLAVCREALDESPRKHADAR